MHPLEQTWNANIEKSKRHPNHLFQRASMTFKIDGHAVALSYDGINMSGKHESSTQTLNADGAEHPIAQAPGVAVQCRLIGDRALETLGKRNGEIIGRGLYEVSADGATMTATMTGVDGQGQAFEQVIVFDRSPSAA